MKKVLTAMACFATAATVSILLIAGIFAIFGDVEIVKDPEICKDPESLALEVIRRQKEGTMGTFDTLLCPDMGDGWGVYLKTD